MMGSLSSSSPGKPLRLKDFLQEDTNSDSCGSGTGFCSVPRRLADRTVRYLLAVELGEATGKEKSLSRRHSKSPLTKITAVINAVKMLPFASSPTACSADCIKPLPKQGSSLSRNFSKKLRKSFWRKREKGESRVENIAVRTTIVRVRDIVRLRSFGDERREVETMDQKTGHCSPPSPVRSTNSSSTTTAAAGGCGGEGGWSDTDSAGSDSSSSCDSSVCCGKVKDGSSHMDATHCASPPSPFVLRGVGEDSISKATRHQRPNAKQEEETGGGKGMGCPCDYEEEKDQLSPVSVMDFPYEEDDNEEEEGDDAEAERTAAAAAPPCFHRSLANLERTKHQLLKKIRQFESLAALVDPVDLNSRFSSPSPSSDADSESDARETRASQEQELREEEAFADDQLLDFQVEIEERAFALLRELERRGAASGRKAGGGGVAELLLDFFIERLSCFQRLDVDARIRTARARRPYDRAAAAEEVDAEEMLLLEAAGWVGGRRRREEGHGWAAEVSEMEVHGRWRCSHVEEEEDIAADMEAVVVDALLDELLVDLLRS